MKMRIALVIPPVRDFYYTRQRGSFLGIHTLADILKRNNIEYCVFNGVRKRGRSEKLPQELGYLSKYLGTSYFFSEFKRYGVTPANIALDVKNYAPHRILISCFAFCYAVETLECVAEIRKLLPFTPIVIGGPGPTVYPEYFIDNSPADFAVVGEADDFLLEILDLENSGKCIINRNDFVRQKATDTNITRFRPVIIKTGENARCCYYSTMVSRGCPRSCPYCSVRQVFPGFKTSHISDIEKMFNGIGKSGKNVHINFEDDNITADFNYLARVIDRMKAGFGGNFSISMENGLDFRYLDEEKISLLKSWNITHLNLSPVSFDMNVLNENKRVSSCAEFENTITIARKNGIPVVAYMIAGLPAQSKDSAWGTLDFLKRQQILVGISCYYPVPGTEGWEDKRGFDDVSPRLCAGSSFFRWNHIETDDLVSIFLDARKYNRSRIKFNYTSR